MQSIIDFVVGILQRDALIGILVICVLIIGGLVYAMIRMGSASKRNGRNDKKDTEEIKQKICDEAKLGLEKQIDIIDMIEKNHGEFGDHIGKLREDVRTLERKLLEVQNDMTKVSRDNAIALNELVSSVDTIVDKVMEISATLRNVVADIFKDRIESRLRDIEKRKQTRGE